MHAPQYQKLFNDYESIRNNHPAIKSRTSPIQREDPIFIPFYDTPQRSKDSRLGASGTQYEAHVPNETTQLTIDDVQCRFFALLRMKAESFCSIQLPTQVAVQGPPFSPFA